MKKLLVLLAIFFCSSSILLAHEKDSISQKEKAIFININAHRNTFPTIDEKFRTQAGFPSFEYQVRTPKRILSFELAKLFYNQKCYGPGDVITGLDYRFLSRNFQAIARFQYQYLIDIHHEHWQPFVGAALSPAYARINRIPMVSTFYPTTIYSLSIDHHASLGTYYNMGKFFLQANALLGISRMGIIGQDIQNPFLVQNAQKYSIFNFDIIPNDIFFRVGIGMKL